MRAGSHFNVPYRLEKYLPLEHIKVVNTGGFGARLKALLDGEVEAASLLPPQIDMADNSGCGQIIEDEFHTLWWVPETAAQEDVRAYLSALDRAEKLLDAGLDKYLHLWKIAIPAEFERFHPWDFGSFVARRALRLPPDPALGVRRGAAAGRALGPRRPPERALLREADLPGLTHNAVPE